MGYQSRILVSINNSHYNHCHNNIKRELDGRLSYWHSTHRIAVRVCIFSIKHIESIASIAFKLFDSKLMPSLIRTPFLLAVFIIFLIDLFGKTCNSIYWLDKFVSKFNDIRARLGLRLPYIHIIRERICGTIK